MDRGTVKADQQRYWDDRVDWYQRVVEPIYEPIVAGVIERACIWPGESALDVGTAAGSLGHRAAERVGPAGEVFGIDPAPEMIAEATRRAQAIGLGNYAAQSGDAQALPFSAETFDVVLSCLTYGRCREPRRAFAEAFRVLRTPGRIIFAVWGRPDRCAFLPALRELAARLPNLEGWALPFNLSDIDDVWNALQMTGYRAAVETVELPFDYPDLETFVDVHAPAARFCLPAEAYADLLAAVRPTLGGPAGPIVATNEVVFGLGYR